MYCDMYCVEAEIKAVCCPLWSQRSACGCLLQRYAMPIFPAKILRFQQTQLLFSFKIYLLSTGKKDTLERHLEAVLCRHEVLNSMWISSVSGKLCISTNWELMIRKTMWVFIPSMLIFLSWLLCRFLANDCRIINWVWGMVECLLQGTQVE